MENESENKREKTGGRQKGSPNKLTSSFKELVQQTFQALENDPNEGGMLKWAKANKTDFYKISSKLIPTEVSLRAEVTQIEIEKTIITNTPFVELPPATAVEDEGQV